MTLRTLLLSCENNVSLPLVSGGTEPVALGLLEHVPQHFSPTAVAKTDVISINAHDGTMAGPPFWDALTDTIAKHYDAYGSFIIATDINAMAEAASALTFSIQNLGKPVIFTGTAALRAIGYEDTSRYRSDSFRESIIAETNLTAALQIADEDVSGIYILCGNRLVHGCRAVHTAMHINGFGLFSPESLVTVGRRSEEQPSFHPGFDGNISVINLSPGVPLDKLTKLTFAEDQPHGIILNGVGTYPEIPKAIAAFFEKASSRGCPVLFAQSNGVSPLADEKAEREVEAGFPALTIIKYMSWPCLVTKFQWVLGRTNDLPYVRDTMQQNIAGEIVEESSPILPGVDLGRAARSNFNSEAQPS
jgi:L-asparaginase